MPGLEKRLEENASRFCNPEIPVTVCYGVHARLRRQQSRDVLMHSAGHLSIHAPITLSNLNLCDCNLFHGPIGVGGAGASVPEGFIVCAFRG